MTRSSASVVFGQVIGMPASSVLRLAAMAAASEGGIDPETLLMMRMRVDAGELDTLSGAAVWHELARGLSEAVPSRMLQALRACGGLAVVLPELDVLFGVPQSADDPPTVDIGEHQLRWVDELARRRAPLDLRFAALVANVGKADSPPEHLPSHYRHHDRALPRIEAMCARFALPQRFLRLAGLVLAEFERVHRASEMRAGSLVALLERVGAFVDEDDFQSLMQVCEADFSAYPGRASLSYPKRRILSTALAAARAVTVDDDDTEALLEARVLAAAAALRSSRWGEAAG